MTRFIKIHDKCHRFAHFDSLSLLYKLTLNRQDMKTRITQSEIKRIEDKINRLGNVSICLGQLSLSTKEKLQKKFKVTKEIFGYYHFEKLK